MVMPHTDNDLADIAENTRHKAYAPYSSFKVGAAIVDENGNMHTGCNVENAAYPLGNCAEISAISAMIASGGRRIVQIAVAGGRGTLESCSPCGGCRQAIAEFSDEHTRIIMKQADGSLKTTTIAELLPHAFRLSAG